MFATCTGVLLVLRRAIHLPDSQKASRTTAADSASPHCRGLSFVVPRSRCKKSAWVMRNAPANSTKAIRFILELLKVSTVKID